MTPTGSEVVVMDDTQIEVLGGGLPVTRQDLDSLRERIALLKEFVRNQMTVDIDYGIIPGCQKPSLFQPGAQKLTQLFGLSVRKESTFKEIDKHANFAMFSYRADIFHGRTGKLLAQCEGSCNSREKKYATRYSQGAKEETPIYDIMNTLQKMAQKRAFVGGVIEACAASDFFTQDIDDPEDAKQLGVRQEPQRASASIPKATRAVSSDQSSAVTCDCGNTMMISKYGPDPKPWYCGKCKATKPRSE